MWITSGRNFPSPVRQLEEFLVKWSSDPSFDRSKADELQLYHIVITRPLIHRLLPLLQHDDVQIDHSPGTATRNDIPALHYTSVQVTCCRFFTEADVTTADRNDDVCTPDDKRSLLSALARLGKSLYLENSDEILSGLLSTAEIDHFEVPRIQICQEALLSNLELARLGAMMERSVKTVDFTPEFHYVDVPDEFYDRLANCIHLQALHFGYSPEKIFPVSKVIAGEDGNGAVERLLRNPHNQLTTLNLAYTNLEDEHLIALAPLLPASKVKVLDLSSNNIHSHGLLEFAKHLPNVHSLNDINISSDPWMFKSAPQALDECGLALLKAIVQNPSITMLHGVYAFKQISRLSSYYLSLNAGGRRILPCSYSSSSSSADGNPRRPQEEEQQESIPPGLWPLILARAGRRDLYYFSEFCYKHNGSATTVYFFLRKYSDIFFKL